MLDTKEIQCFVTCAQTGSFSKAAEKLFTTQSSVSKIVKSMEEKIGCFLFERTAKGIHMTPEAEKIYPYAISVLENLKQIQMPDKKKKAEVLSVSGNPSSWFADYFVKFYERKQGEALHYQVHSAQCREIVERVRKRTDELGFVYIMQDQASAFQYYAARNYLEFTSLKETEATIYYGGSCRMSDTAEEGLDFSEMKLIQRFPDEFSPDNYWNIVDSNGKTASDAEIVITTNSDYIMERLLKSGNLANISGGYLSGKPKQEITEGQVCTVSDARILFGYVKRKGEKLSESAKDFLEFLIESLKD